MDTHPPSGGPAPGARLLLVDDEAVVRRVTATALRRFGYAVIEAKTAEEGIRLAREHAGALDLLVTDLMIEEASGFDVARDFLAHNPGRPVLFTSGYGDDETRERVDAEGGHFLIKPYDIESLATVVRQALDDRGGGAAPRLHGG